MSFTMTFPSGHASAGTVVPLKWRKIEQPINIYIKPVLDDKTIKKYVHHIACDIIYRTPYTECCSSVQVLLWALV